MSWSYDPTLPTDKDRVRLLVGDTNTLSQLISDEAIQFALEGSSVYPAAAAVAEMIAATFTGVSSVSIEGISVNYSDKAKAYFDLAAKLRAKGSLSNGAAIVTGISLGEMAGVSSDTDRNPSRVTVGFTDEPIGYFEE